ncbi:MAG: sigma-70 family RNA polymerase sigma factor [Acutalibacteraceae bacterium]|nr:sigma-70 family RNA polymerase sigma factor [Acutalibacteraceae bacterium]
MIKENNNGITEEVLCAEYSAVFHYVLSLCRNESEAQDITQEAFLKALKASDKYAGESSLYTWLCAIAKNLWLNKCKKYKHEVIPESENFLESSNTQSLEDLLVDRDMTMYVHTILHSLEEPYKEVFSLRVFGQLSFVDIAKLFGKTDSWARVTYHRARKLILDKLRKGGYYE